MENKNNDENIPPIKKEINITAHLGFFKRCMQVMPSAYQSQEVNRLTLSYFIISGLDILGKIDLVDKQKTIDWVYSLQVLPDKDEPEKDFENCGFRGSGFVGVKYNPNCEPTCMHPHDQGHIAMNYCALAILAMLGDDYSRINKQAILKSMRKMQQEDGSFACVNRGAEMDMRFVYCACVVSYLLNDWSGIDVEKATNYILKAQNYDHGFGQGGSKESHGGSTFCAIASLYLMKKIDLIPNKEKLVEWLIHRQYTGFEGRINKPPDVCYSFWIGGSLKMLEAWDLVNFEHLRSFLYDCQGEHIGGFSKLVGHHPDVLHSYYAMCGLSFGGEKGLLEIVPCVGMTKRAHDLWAQNIKK